MGRRRSGGGNIIVEFGSLYRLRKLEGFEESGRIRKFG
jgi:hypothetical protein